MEVIKEKLMASDTFKNTMIGLVLFVLFSSLILTAVISLGLEYGKSSSEIGGGSLNLSSFDNSISSVNESAEGFRERFSEGNIENVDNPTGIFSILTDMISLIFSPFQLLGILLNSLGVPTIVTNVVLGLLVITLILAIWRILRQGD